MNTIKKYVDIDPSDVSGEKLSMRIIDVREPEEFTGELGHIEGAELVPLTTVADVAKSWDRNAGLLMVCRTGGRSGRAAALLAERGFANLRNLRGGMTEWNARGLPVKR